MSGVLDDGLESEGAGWYFFARLWGPKGYLVIRCRSGRVFFHIERTSSGAWNGHRQSNHSGHREMSWCIGIGTFRQRIARIYFP